MSTKPNSPAPGTPVKLTDAYIDAVTEPGTYPLITEPAISGFRLRVGESGIKSYQVVGKVRGESRPVYCTIGKHGDPWTPKTARLEAGRLRLLMQQGVNPNQQKKDESKRKEDERKAEAAEREVKELTLRAALEELMEKNQRDSTKKGYRALRSNVKDWLDKPLIEVVSKESVSERYAEIADKSPSMAVATMRMLRAAWTTAQIKHGDSISELNRSNPVQILNHTNKGWDTPTARETHLSDESLPAFYQAVMSLDNDVPRDYLLIAILSGLRRDEINTLAWADVTDQSVIALSRVIVDLRKRTIILRKGRTKNKQRHVLWMPDYLYELFLRRWESPARDKWVLPGNTPAGHFDDPTWAIDKICRDTGIKPVDGEGRAVDHRFTSHDLRRTFSNTADSLGYSLQEIQRLLNHKGKSVAERHYIQSQAERTKEPMERVNERLLALMQSPAQAAPTNVVPLTKSAG